MMWNLGYLDEHLQRYISSGELAGTLIVVNHRNRMVHWSAQGLRDRERDTSVEDDTIFRVHSMTKPIVSMALMQLYERGLFQLDDPVHRYIPAWEKLRVYQSGEFPNFQTTPCERPITVRDLLSHQAGLCAPALQGTPVDDAYRAVGIGGRIGRGGTTNLQDMIDALAELPLDYSPGTGWSYSMATDVVGYLVQLISGQRLDSYLQDQIFDPLGMTDTGFWVKPHQVERLATNYRGLRGGGIEIVDDKVRGPYLREPTYHSGSGGLVSTAGDYLRFCRMLLGQGKLEGARIVGRKTLQLMTLNHITGGKSIASAATGAWWRERPQHVGVGFGLGFAVVLDTLDRQASTTPGMFYWSGAASTYFWIDPAEELAVVFMTQYMPPDPEHLLKLRSELRAIVYGALE
jgi:CubicO group peptidase (beta-lactamase class C family)